MAKKKPKTEWAKRLRKLRRKLDITQREAAERCNVPLRTWINWENGQPASLYAQKHVERAFPELSQ